MYIPLYVKWSPNGRGILKIWWIGWGDRWIQHNIWECLPPMGLTHFKAWGESYHEPHHTHTHTYHKVYEGEGFYAYFLVIGQILCI
jgi:hypothetical protein